MGAPVGFGIGEPIYRAVFVMGLQQVDAAYTRRDNAKDGRKEPPVETPMHERANTFKTYTIVLAVLLGLGIVLFAASVVSRLSVPTTPIQAVTMQEHAWYACTAHIAEQLKFSFLDAQRYNPGGVTIVSSDTYQVKVSYSKQGSTILCKIQHTPSGNWQLLELTRSRRD